MLVKLKVLFARHGARRCFGLKLQFVELMLLALALLFPPELDHR